MEVITGPNGKTQLVDENGKKFYVLVHTFYDGSENHPEEALENLQGIIESGGYTGKCPFDGCESIITPEDIQGVLSDDFYKTFSKEFGATKVGGKRRTYRSRKKSRKTANILPGGL